jgi:RNA polymerase sigma-70 factor, ECF subfamily
MVEVKDRTRESFQRLTSVVLPTLYWLARLHRGRKRFEQELWAYAQETGLLLKGTVQ